MILTVTELRAFLDTPEEDDLLTKRLLALEEAIHRYTCNDFAREKTPSGEYPEDVKLGVVNLLRWELDARERVGVSSETIARHSISYADATGADSLMGYPRGLMGFLQPYIRARFGKGLNA